MKCSWSCWLFDINIVKIYILFHFSIIIINCSFNCIYLAWRTMLYSCNYSDFSVDILQVCNCFRALFYIQTWFCSVLKWNSVFCSNLEITLTILFLSYIYFWFCYFPLFFWLVKIMSVYTSALVFPCISVGRQLSKLDPWFNHHRLPRNDSLFNRLWLNDLFSFCNFSFYVEYIKSNFLQ